MCDADQPLSRNMLFKLFFENNLSTEAAKRIERRALVPEDVFLSAPVFTEEKKAAFSNDSTRDKQQESLRIREQTHLKHSQPLLKVVSSVSRAFGICERLLINHDGPDHELDLGEFESKFRSIREFCQDALFSTSDSLHLVGMECTELERQRDDLYMQCTSGDKSYRTDRPSANPTVL
eukprot:SAG11_NODE_9_length_28972_cov_81.532539_8_plen_178_part_00